jgi:hypothetical protein
MTIRVSSNLSNFIPDLKEMLYEVAACSRSLDRKIRTKHLYVEARCAPWTDDFSGTAFAEAYTIDRRWQKTKVILHENGKVTMSLGSSVGFEHVARLFAHELRHIGQFHRGKERYGFLFCVPKSEKESEIDAFCFEQKVVDRLL